MNTETGEIKEFSPEVKPGPKWVPITKHLAGELWRHDFRKRRALFHDFKLKVIRQRKRELGRKLTQEELKNLFSQPLDNLSVAMPADILSLTQKPS